MKCILQRTSYFRSSAGEFNGPGLVLFITTEAGDTQKEAAFIGQKAAGLRIFEDKSGKMNLSVMEMATSRVLLSLNKLTDQAGEEADELLEKASEELGRRGVAAVKAPADEVQISFVNDGPVTLILDSGISRRGHKKAEAGEMRYIKGIK